MLLTHDVDFDIELTDKALVSEYKTNGNETTLIIISPEAQDLFEAKGDFDVVETYIANYSGTEFVSTSTVTDYAIMSNYPNPFNPSTTVSYELFTEAFVNLSVYNVVGQEVASLVNGVVGIGEHSVVWNGLDATGNEVSSGVYILQLNTQSEVISSKITLLR